MTVVANLPKLWRTFRSCEEPSNFVANFPVANLPDTSYYHTNFVIFLIGSTQAIIIGLALQSNLL